MSNHFLIIITKNVYFFSIFNSIIYKTQRP